MTDISKKKTSLSNTVGRRLLAKTLVAITGVVVVVAASLVGGTAAQANTPKTLNAETVAQIVASPVSNVDAVTSAAAYRDLKASNVSRTRATVDGVAYDTFALTGGVALSFPVAAAPVGVQPQLAFGVDGIGPYISFNRIDQGALLSGGGAALATAICFIPGIGIPACIVAAGLTAAATAYLVANGICGSYRQILHVHYLTLGYPGCYRS